jgi:sugar phosphate isomerase/epimerase
MTTAPLRIGMETFGYLYRATLQSSLESIARAGYATVEISSVPPHLPVTGFDVVQRRQLKRLLDDLGLTCVSVNNIELNLISPNTELREVALRQYRQSVVLAHDLGARVINVIAGRGGVLMSMPTQDATEVAVAQLAQLLKDAHEYGVHIALEIVPFGFVQTTDEMVALVRALDDDLVGICVDVANIYGHEDVRAAVSTVAPFIKLAHLSDTWRDRYAHTSIGRGEVDFPEFLDTLRTVNFSGPCIYELVDGEDPDQRIGDDLTTLRNWGWTS